MSAQHEIRLFLADVDGALVTRQKELTAAAKMAVRELDRAGIVFAITSGRPPRGMSMLIEPLALKTAIAGFNGGVLVKPDPSVIESLMLDPAAAKQAGSRRSSARSPRRASRSPIRRSRAAGARHFWSRGRASARFSPGFAAAMTLCRRGVAVRRGFQRGVARSFRLPQVEPMVSVPLLTPTNPDYCLP